MARTLNRLSERRVRTAKTGLHFDGGGLYLQVTAGADGGTLQRSWLFRYKSPATGHERQMGLGALVLTGLADARRKAAEGRKSLLDGSREPRGTEIIDRPEGSSPFSMKQAMHDLAANRVSETPLHRAEHCLAIPAERGKDGS